MLVLYNGCTFITIRVKGEIKAMMVTGIKAASLKSNMNFGATYTKADRRKILDKMGVLADKFDICLYGHDTVQGNKINRELRELIRIFTQLITFNEVRGMDILL